MTFDLYCPNCNYDPNSTRPGSSWCCYAERDRRNRLMRILSEIQPLCAIPILAGPFKC